MFWRSSRCWSRGRFMDAGAERRQQDLLRLEELTRQTAGRVKVISTDGKPLRELVVELDYATAFSTDYPSRTQRPTRVRIEVSSRYPFQEPRATITTPIFHPNVFPSGQICLGKKWLPTESLALLVRRIIQIVTFDPTILNEASPANPKALQWYRSAKGRAPGAFPTESVVIHETPQPPKKMEWRDTTANAEPKQTVVVACHACSQKLRVEAGRSGRLGAPPAAVCPR